MGTRNLTCVYVNGEYKVAQYGQWDGYPDGVGVGILTFLEQVDKNDLVESLKKVRFLDVDGVDKEFIEEYDKNCPEWSSDPDNRTPEQKHWFDTYITRDLSDDVLWNIVLSSDEEIVLRNEIEFAKDGLYCEWAYVIDLDKNTFEVYEGFTKEPLDESERFYFNGEFLEYNISTQYYPVKFVCSFDLDNLPSKEEFVKTVTELTSEDDEDEE